MSVDARVLGASLQRLRTSGDQDLQEMLDQVVTACVGVFGVTGAGLMVADEQNSLRYVSASDGPGRILERCRPTAGRARASTRSSTTG
jgi:hypothetical protein